MIWPEARDVLFSLKAFAAAMLAFWVACALDLPRPVWAVFTVYALMQPVSGAVRSKAVFRMIGTVAGALIALLLTAVLANLPAALFLCVGLTTLFGVFLSMIDQMPRGYTYLMAGITAAIVGLPAALDPLSCFTTAVARTEESLLGIACATLVDTVFFPHAAGTMLNARVVSWFDRAKDYTLKALRPPDGPGDSHAELGGLAAEASQLDALASHVAYDIVPNRPAPRIVRLLHTRMLLLTRLMFAVHDWAPELRGNDDKVDPLQNAVIALREWLLEIPTVSPARAEAAQRAIDDLRDAPAGAVTTLHRSLEVILRDLMLGFQDCMALQRAVTDGAPLPDHLRHAARTERLSIPYRDPVRALLVLLPVALAFLLVIAYWTAAGWDQGRTAALMTLVAGVFASSTAEPYQQFVRVLAVMAVAAAVAIVYQFAIMPAVQGFPLLALALGVFLIPAGAFIPITLGTGLLLTVLTALMLSLQPEYNGNFTAVLDGDLGTLAGLAAATVVARITLVPGTAWTTRHLLRAGWSDLAAISARRWRPGHAAYALRALDRFTVLAPQLDMSEQETGLTTAALLGEMRIGLNLLRLHDAEPALPPPARTAIDTLSRALAQYFADRCRDAGLRPDSLREPSAKAMAAAVAAMPASSAQTAWLMLAGMQRSLFGPATPQEPVQIAHAG
jgi:uncharacterized membrane protein YccC